MSFRHRLFLLTICALLGLVVSLAGLFLWQKDDAWPLRDPVCADLFRLENDTDRDSGRPWKPYIPPEAQQPQPTPAPPAPVVAPNCRDDLALLPVETVEEGPGYLLSFALSPSSRQIAYLVYLDLPDRNETRLIVRDLATGQERRFVDAWDWPMFWLDEETLIAWDSYQKVHDPKGQKYLSQPCLFNVRYGKKTRLAERWEYSDPDPGRFTTHLYTGWQAAALLTVSKGEICRATQQGLLPTVRAEDGTLLLSREDLLAKGGPLVRSWYGNLLTGTEISELIGRAAEVKAITGHLVSRSPFRDIYPLYDRETEQWHRYLVLMGLPEAPHNLLINVASTAIGASVPLVPGQTQAVFGRFLVEPTAHPLFSVARDACFDADAGGYGYVLYRKGVDGGPPAPLGVIPFPYKGGEMVWSPDGQWIYFEQSALGRQSISRLRLPVP